MSRMFNISLVQASSFEKSVTKGAREVNVGCWIGSLSSEQYRGEREKADDLVTELDLQSVVHHDFRAALPLRSLIQK